MGTTTITVFPAPLCKEATAFRAGEREGEVVTKGAAAAEAMGVAAAVEVEGAAVTPVQMSLSFLISMELGRAQAK